MAPIGNGGGHFCMPEVTYLGMNEVQAIVYAALLAAFVAIWAIFSQRAITARQTTLEFIRASDADRDNIAARQTFNEHARDEDGMGKWARDEHAKSDQAR